MIRVWEGFVSLRDTRVVFVVFDGELLGGLVFPLDNATVEFTFYRTRGGRVVVHEARLGHWGAGHPYDEAVVRVYSSLNDACAHLNINNIDPLRRNTNSRRVNAPGAPVITLTLDEL